MPLWTDVPTVQLMTGVSVDDWVIERAEFDVAMIAGISLVNFDEDMLSDYDNELLASAASVQAAWLYLNTAGTYSNHDINSLSQDGASNGINPTAMVLAPRARMFIEQLSWVRPRQVALGSKGRRYSSARINNVRGPGWMPHSRRLS